MGNVDTMAMAVRTAADLGATVINISSVACDIGSAIHDRALGAALAYAVDVKDVVVVAAAGNVGYNHQCPQQNPPPNPLHPNKPDWETANIVVSPGLVRRLCLDRWLGGGRRERVVVLLRGPMGRCRGAG